MRVEGAFKKAPTTQTQRKGRSYRWNQKGDAGRAVCLRPVGVLVWLEGMRMRMRVIVMGTGSTSSSPCKMHHSITCNNGRNRFRLLATACLYKCTRLAIVNLGGKGSELGHYLMRLKIWAEGAHHHGQGAGIPASGVRLDRRSRDP